MTPRTLSERLVKSTSGLIATRRSRRRFFGEVAVVGSALAMNPITFATRPVGAQDSVCGNDTQCEDGYTVFCCTITGGGNICPSDTFVGGWWKADDSGFCCGGPRYYIDCNAVCGSSWGCECEDSPDTCDQRRIACNQFRYGQCNTQISCYGPVVCRVITCTAPWVFDPYCGTTSATDDNTTTQSAPCLPGDCPSPIIMHYYDLGGPASFLGTEVAAEVASPDGGGTWAQFQYGAIFDLDAYGLVTVSGDIWFHYEVVGGPGGVLGNPTTSQYACADGVGQYNLFQNDGAIYWTPQFNAWAIHGSVFDKWSSFGREQSFLGYPTTDVETTPDGAGRYTLFETLNGSDHGAIYWTEKFGAWSIHEQNFTKWTALGREQSYLGYPVSDVGTTPDGIGRWSLFEKLDGSDHGAIYWTQSTGAHALHSHIWEKWTALGREQSYLGYPATDQNTAYDHVGQYVEFAKITDGSESDHGAIYWNPTIGAHAVHGPIYAKWQTLNRAAGPLGYPTTDPTTTPDGKGLYNLFNKIDDGTIVSRGGIYRTPSNATHPVYGRIFQEWTKAGREQGSYGYPIADPVTSGGVTTQHFQHGTLSSNS